MGKFLGKRKISQIYTQLSSDDEVDLSDLIITLSRNDKIYPKTKKNPSKQDFETVILDRCRDWTVRARSLLLTCQNL